MRTDEGLDNARRNGVGVDEVSRDESGTRPRRAPPIVATRTTHGHADAASPPA
ncbi:hypothetical protein [Micromonospora sp. KC723]|uniref:hypothetical protein n=1 Tax=Micromonospora sp. KC723 TaxID=2530381 RepID=UPI001404528B|nr:hypothetical protein [Micromonospora sp. KC723]